LTAGGARVSRSAVGGFASCGTIPREKGQILLESGAIRCLLLLAHKGPISSNPCVIRRKVISMKQMSKSELIQTIADQHSGTVTRKDVKGIIESLASVGYKELKKSGAFVLPGFAKFVVVKKPATKARKGINPFTKEPTIFKAKPARKLIKARPVKAVKDAV
jgi:DNA-binding protein HU-beta